MGTTPRAFAIAVSTALVLAIAAAGASAGRLSTSEREFVITWSRLEIEAAGNLITCPMTVTGHFAERTMVKARESAGASIASATTGTCTGGTVTILTETLPWHLLYTGFEGTLPNISGISDSITGLAARAQVSGGTTCLIGTTASFPWKWIKKFFIVGGALIGVIEAIRTAEIPLSGGFVCEIAGNAHIGGGGRMTNLPGTAGISVTLI